jgi:hypothetical protein
MPPTSLTHTPPRFCAGARAVLAEDATAAVPTRGLAVRPANAPVVLGEHTAYFTGTRVTVEVWATRACHIYVVNQDHTGVLVPILPNNSEQTGADARLHAPGERRERVMPADSGVLPMAAACVTFDVLPRA